MRAGADSIAGCCSRYEQPDAAVHSIEVDEGREIGRKTSSASWNSGGRTTAATDRCAFACYMNLA